MLDNFIQTFANLLSNGINKISSVALVIASILAVIDFLFSFMYEYANEFQQIFKKLSNKIINYAFVFALIKGYKKVLDAITITAFNIGNKFFPEGKVSFNGKFPSFDSIYDNLKLSVLNMEKDRSSLSWSDFGAQLLYLFLILIGFFLIFMIVKEIIVSYIEFRVTATIGLLLVPFLALEQTKPYGTKLWNSLLNTLSKLLISLILTGITLQVLSQRNFVAGNGKVEVGAAISHIFMLGLSAYLIANTKEFANMLSNGTMGGRVGSSLVSSVTGAALAGTGAMITGGVAGYGAASKGVQAYRSGKNLRGVLNSMKAGASSATDVLKASRASKMASKMSRGFQNTVDYASGNRSFTNVFSDIYNGTVGTASEQLFHDKYDVIDKIADFKSGNTSKLSDFINNDYSMSSSATEAFKEFRKPTEDPKFRDRLKRAYNKYKENRAFEKTKDYKEEMIEKAKKRYTENKKKIAEIKNSYIKKRFTK